jgi:hypothetical protein
MYRNLAPRGSQARAFGALGYTLKRRIEKEWMSHSGFLATIHPICDTERVSRQLRSARSQVVRKAMHEGLFKIFCVRYRRQDLPLGPSKMFFSRQDSTQIPSHLGGGGACICRSVWRRGGYGRIRDGTRALELAADSREATLGYGARSMSTSMVTASRPKGGKHETIGEEDYRDGRSREVWRWRSSWSAVAGIPYTEVFE